MLRYMYMCAVCYNAGVKLLSVMQFKDWLILSRIISFHLTDCICRVGLSHHLGWAEPAISPNNELLVNFTASENSYLDVSGV